MKILSQILFLFLILTPAESLAQKAKDSYASSSVLSSGVWFRIAITSDGIYRIDYSKLRQMGLVNPANPRIFGNNFGQLSYFNDDPKPDDLREIAIFTSTGSDDIFNEGDYLLFYGKGSSQWKFNSATREYDYRRHNYSDTAFYFITSGSVPGKRITPAPTTSLTANYQSSESDILYFYEKDDKNIIKSGREWFQQISTLRINPGFANLVPSEKIKYNIRVAARASVQTVFRLYEGTSLKQSSQIQPVNLFASTGTWFQITDSTGTLNPESSSPIFDIKYFNNGEASAEGYLDFVKLHGRKSNTFTGSSVQFSDSKSVSPGQITEFGIKTTSGDAIIWDISDPYAVKQVAYTKTGDNIVFKSITDSLKNYIAFNSAGTTVPVIKESKLNNQDLHLSPPADMIIVTHPLFLKYAEKLAGIHYYNSGLISLVTTPQQIYNEFSGGIPDIAAIRNFARMKFLKQSGTDHPLKYLLLFGDGSYENKTPPPFNPNFIPTYQSQNSNVVVSSFTSDDFYGLLEDGEGEAEGTEDIGIGRLPVSDTVQAGIVISKIIKYLDPASMGQWKNVICLVADDEDGNIHMSDAEGLATILRDSVPAYNVEKIYLDAFRQNTSVNGQSYPDVNKAINNRINAGCLIFNYVGHGNERSLAHEVVVKTEEINSWKNNNKLPLFITATCEFSRFDDVEINIATREYTGKTSAGELVLLSKDGGGIALMSTTRVVYSAPNYYLNKNIFDVAFDLDENGNTMRLGDIIRIAKNKSGNGPNKRNFSLLGDPALKLAYPWHGKVITDSVNNIAVTENTDSLKALSLITVAGHIEDPQGNLFSDFNGIVSPLVYDKLTNIKTLGNDGGQIMEFKLRNNILFSGKTMAKNGRFRFTFMVPRDIDYSYGTGKISYYANDDDKDLNGAFTGFIVGGFSNSIIPDNTGPDIRLFLNDTLFRDGGITDSNPQLLAIIEDNSGINTTGAGIGHDLAGYIDDETNNTFVLNNYFENDFDDYKKGRIVYDLTGLSAGRHSLTLKAWDYLNNSSEKTITFFVETDGKFVLTDLINYPNPFFNDTKITAGHNRPDTELDVTINIYSLDGRIIRTIKTSIQSTGYALPPVIWDGCNESGSRVGRGLYPYSVTIRTREGETAMNSGRMVIL